LRKTLSQENSQEKAAWAPMFWCRIKT